MWNELLHGLSEGNSYLLAMSVVGFLTLVIAIERIILLTFVYNINYVKFLNNLRKLLSSKEYSKAIQFCRKTSRTSVPYIAQHAITAYENDPSKAQATLEEQTLEFLPRIETRISWLPVFATVVLFLGILATIDQLWWAFYSFDVLNTSQKQLTLSSYISKSLNPTAGALVLSSTIFIIHQILKSSALKIIDYTHYSITVISNLLESNRKEILEEVKTTKAQKSKPPSEKQTQTSKPESDEKNESTQNIDTPRDEEEIL